MTFILSPSFTDGKTETPRGQGHAQSRPAASLHLSYLPACFFSCVLLHMMFECLFCLEPSAFPIITWAKDGNVGTVILLSGTDEEKLV